MEKSLTIDGDWKLFWADGQRGIREKWMTGEHYAKGNIDSIKWIDARVPGEVHLDLIRAGFIPEPTLGLNVLAARWVEESFWLYRKSFVVPEELLSQKRSWLYFGGLDYSARIFLNGIEIGTHSNFFVPFRVEVTGKLVPGENVLLVELESGLYSVADKKTEGLFNPTQDGNLHKRLWLRKPQCSFGWDWSPRLINVGIHGSVRLEWSTCVLVEDVSIQTCLDVGLAQGTIRITAHLQSVSPEQTSVRMEVSLVGTEHAGTVEKIVASGGEKLECSIDVPNPRLWWPVGHGEPHVYEVAVRLLLAGEVLAETVRTVGFRHIRFNQDPHPSGGRYFILEVNGRPVFAKGANMVPADIIFSRIDRARYEMLVDRALEANFNMLRVWGGGIYESDDFYELCNRRGIMVWQEFIFACGAYPGTDEAFFLNVMEEATYQIRRLSSHPSLILWCGNNENELLTWNKQDGVIYPDYAIYHHLLPRLIKEEDPSRFYLPSSPYSPDNNFANADDEGDQHPWQEVGISGYDFYKFRERVCRFPNEGGYLGPNSLQAIQASLTPGQEYMHSFAWQQHENGVETIFPGITDRMIGDWVGRDPRAFTLEEYCYYGGLVQGEALREYIDNFRRRKFDCAAAIFWMYNDCWPTTRSWTIVDYYLNRTPSFHPVRRGFSPVHIVLSEQNDQIVIYGINETTENWQGSLVYGVFTPKGKYVSLEPSQWLVLPPNESVPIAVHAKSILAEMPTERIAFAELLDKAGGLVARNKLLLTRYPEASWAAAKVKCERRGSKAVFHSDVFVWGVCIDLEGKKRLSDNFFDLYPGREYEIDWPDDEELPAVLYIGNLVLQTL